MLDRSNYAAHNIKLSFFDVAQWWLVHSGIGRSEPSIYSIFSFEQNPQPLHNVLILWVLNKVSIMLNIWLNADITIVSIHRLHEYNVYPYIILCAF
jgi:hypothetical protein